MLTTEVSTTVVPGNTKTDTTFRSRNFQLTLNKKENYNDLINEFKKLKTCKFLISCLEVAPTTGHEHIHIYVHFEQPYKISKAILKYGAHIEICKGSPKQNIAYIEKDGNIIEEWGTRPTQGSRTVGEMKEMNIDEVSPQYYKIKKQIDEDERSKNTFFSMLDEIRNDNLKAPEIIYITGPSGRGKTYKAYKLATEKYKNEEIGKLTLNNNFIDIVNETAKCFVIEEFRDSQIKASDFLQLTDKYGYRANVKGGFVTLRPETIIICSIIDPKNIYHDEINKQFMRRITKHISLFDGSISID